ncbi:MAG TPA: hypothetical protein VFV50_08400 [Bdellovibrionales bacterium]|nr:hypothetical protein [Bdellovibrionales bacterium]
MKLLAGVLFSLFIPAKVLAGYMCYLPFRAPTSRPYYKSSVALTVAGCESSYREKLKVIGCNDVRVQCGPVPREDMLTFSADCQFTSVGTSPDCHITYGCPPGYVEHNYDSPEKWNDPAIHDAFKSIGIFCKKPGNEEKPAPSRLNNEQKKTGSGSQ